MTTIESRIENPLQPCDWINVFKKYHPTRSVSLHVFVSIVGCIPEVIHELWIKYIHKQGFKSYELLWAISFLHVYAINDDTQAGLWGMSDNAYFTPVWELLHILYDVIDEVDWNSRKHGLISGGLFDSVSIAIDTTEVPIANSKHATYSAYKKRHTMKYEAAISLGTGLFVWCPVPGTRGPTADQTLFHKYGIAGKMDENELFLGDGHYIGLPHSFVQTLHQMKQLNEKVGHVRAIVEHAFSRLKDFNCLVAPFRHSLCMHHVVFKICIHVTNLKFKYQPLHQLPHRLLWEHLIK